MAKLKATYSIPELAALAGMSRWAMRRFLLSKGVELDRSGRKRVVYLSAIRRALPDLWESILDRESAVKMR